MKSCSIFLIIFIGFFVIFGNGEDLDSFDVEGSGSTTVTGENEQPSTTADSGNPTNGATNNGQTDASTQPSVTDGENTNPTEPAQSTVSSGNSDAPQNTVSSGQTGAPQTTAAPAPVCPSQDLIYVKNDGTSALTVTIPAGLNCTYYARTTNFSSSVEIMGTDQFPRTDGTLIIFGDGDQIFDSSADSSADPLMSNSSQVAISIVTTTNSANVDLQFSLHADECVNDICKNGGTCLVIQGQETCACPECKAGPRCETVIDPCVTYQLVCGTKLCQSSGCTATCQS